MDRHAVRWRIAVLVAISLAGCGRHDARDELKRFTGNWAVVHLESGGIIIPKEQRRAFDVTITDAHVKMNVGVRQLRAVYVLRPAKSPREIDLEAIDDSGKDRPKRMTRGIYRWEGERLTLCLGDADQPRPADFTTSPGTGRILLVLERDR